MKYFKDICIFCMLISLCSSCSVQEVPTMDLETWSMMLKPQEFDVTKARAYKYDFDIKDNEGYNYLGAAAAHGNSDALRFLLGSFLVSDKHLNHQSDVFKTTPIISAVMSGDLESCVILIEYDANIYIDNFMGKNAYEIAELMGKDDILKIMIQHKKINDKSL